MKPADLRSPGGAAETLVGMTCPGNASPRPSQGGFRSGLGMGLSFSCAGAPLAKNSGTIAGGLRQARCSLDFGPHSVGPDVGRPRKPPRGSLRSMDDSELVQRAHSGHHQPRLLKPLAAPLGPSALGLVPDRASERVEEIFTLLQRLAGARSHGGRSLSVDEGRYFPESGSVITLMAIGGRARDRQTAAVEGNRRELGTFKTEVIMLQLTHKRASADGVSLPYVTVGSDPAVLCLRGWPRTNASFCRCSAAARTAIGSSR